MAHGWMTYNTWTQCCCCWWVVKRRGAECQEARRMLLSTRKGISPETLPRLSQRELEGEGGRGREEIRKRAIRATSHFLWRPCGTIRVQDLIIIALDFSAVERVQATLSSAAWNQQRVTQIKSLTDILMRTVQPKSKGGTSQSSFFFLFSPLLRCYVCVAEERRV